MLDSDKFNQNDGNGESRVFLVTGATGAIGKAIALQLAETPGHEVVLVGRDEVRTRQATSDVIRATGNDRTRYEIADLSRQADILALADWWRNPLHVLINDAAVTPRVRQETPEGIEIQFATNVLGYFWMTQAFRDILARSAPARVINVSSYWAGDMDLGDLEFRRRRYNNNRAYRQSKQANRMLTAAFAERLKSRGISVNACHPGDVSSRLSNNLGFGGHESPEEGADTPVWLAKESVGQVETGKYFEQRNAVKDRFSQDRAAVEALYQACLAYDNS
jgi:NAD(P)-dependent dehydrogenase (short-subunit alcohol dehydrogenase family)